jgi:alpha-beta hydrolase superfamily lysophospholipase
MSSITNSNRRALLRALPAAALYWVGRTPLGMASQPLPQASPSRACWFSSFRATDYYERGADLGEVLAVGRRIPVGDFEAYLREWGQLAARTEQVAEKQEREGRAVTAANTWLRASNYASKVYGVYLRFGNGKQARPAYRRVRDLFTKGMEMAGAAAGIERVTIPYLGTTLKGWFAQPACDERRRPAVYHTGGADTTKETTFFRNFVWTPYLERGDSCLVLDSPGQGEALNLDGLHMQARFEEVSKAVTRYLASRPDVDPLKIGVFGNSMGGYFAGRAAAFDNRVAAVALQSAWYDMLRDSYDHCPQFQAQLRYLLGAANDREARHLLLDFNFHDIANKIEVPIYIVHGDRDQVVRVEGAKQLFAEIASKDKHLTLVPGARHNLDRQIPRMMDWLVMRVKGPVNATFWGEPQETPS